MTCKVKKYGITIIAAVLLVAIAFAGAASAATYSGGSGTAEDPYQISTVADLRTMVDDEAAFQNTTGVHFKLMNDISISDISSVAGDPATKTVTVTSAGNGTMTYNWSSNTFDKVDWKPVFDPAVLDDRWYPSTPIKNGKISLDGNQKTISGLFMLDTGGWKTNGFFSIVEDGSLTVTNLTVDKSFIYDAEGGAGCVLGGPGPRSSVEFANCNVRNCAVIGTTGAGSLIGRNYDDENLCGSVTVKNCTAMMNAVVSHKIDRNSGMDAGGLYGGGPSLKSAIFEDCSVMNCFVESKGKHAGGVVGNLQSQDPKSSFKNCNVTGCTINGDSYVGGLVGNGNILSFSNCHAIGCDIASNGGSTGGLYGGNSDSSVSMILEDCSAFMCNISVSAPEKSDKRFDYVGGLAGMVTGEVRNSTAEKCTVIIDTALDCTRVGGLTGKLKSSDNCSVIDCTVILNHTGLEGVREIGGLSGYVDGGNVTNSNVTDSCILVAANLSAKKETNNFLGGIAGYCIIESGNIIANCHVLNSTITSNIYRVGGLFGCFYGSPIVTQCSVENCPDISGSGTVGGIVGEGGECNLKINHTSIQNATIRGSTGIREIVVDPEWTKTEKQYVGGFIGNGGKNYVLDIDNITLSDLDIQVLGKDKNDDDYNDAYLITNDNSNNDFPYKIHSPNGIARLAEIILPDNIKILNTRLLIVSKGENPVLEGFTDVNNYLISINVSNPKVTAIGKDAFKGDPENGKFSELHEITGLDSITEIGESAFENCSLKLNPYYGSIVELLNVKTIGDRAFKESGLSYLMLDKVETIGESAFENCSMLENIISRHYIQLKIGFPKTLKTIGDRAFYGCNVLDLYNSLPVEIPEGTESIGEEAFYGCNRISSITVPSTVTSIGDHAFGDSDTAAWLASNAIIYDHTGGLVTDDKYNKDVNVVAVLVNSTTMEYKFMGSDTLLQDYDLVYSNNQPIAKPDQVMETPRFIGWSTEPGNYSEETKVENINEALWNDTGKYWYAYPVWEDKYIYILQQVYDVDGFPIPGTYVDRNGDGVITLDDAYSYKVILEYGVTELPIDTRMDGGVDTRNTKILTYHYKFWPLSAADAEDPMKGIKKFGDIIIPYSERTLKPNMVVTLDDGTKVRYTDSYGRFVYNGSDPYFGVCYSDYAINASASASSPSGSNGGATIVQNETPTRVPTVSPTADVTPVATSTIKPTAKPTAQQTQKSPAPFVGLIAGLGAALVLARMRR